MNKLPKYVSKITFNNNQSCNICHDTLLSMADLTRNIKQTIKDNKGINNIQTFFKGDIQNEKI